MDLLLRKLEVMTVNCPEIPSVVTGKKLVEVERTTLPKRIPDMQTTPYLLPKIIEDLQSLVDQVVTNGYNKVISSFLLMMFSCLKISMASLVNLGE